jgi:hypothetical protein
MTVEILKMLQVENLTISGRTGRPDPAYRQSFYFDRIIFAFVGERTRPPADTNSKSKATSAQPQCCVWLGVQSGLSYTFAPGGWAALNIGYFKGARTTVDEVESDVEQQGIRFGATLVLPLNRYQSVKLYSISGYNANREHDFQAFGIAWQYRWGGGF